MGKTTGLGRELRAYGKGDVLHVEHGSSSAKDKLGEAAFVCRWRLVEGRLPLKGRHLRALGARRVHNETLSAQHVAWASQHIDWTLYEAAHAFADSVLIVYVDEDLKMGMGIGEYRPLRRTAANDLLKRARASLEEARLTGVSPEDLWIVRDNVLLRSYVSPSHESGVSSLISDLALTLGKPMRLVQGLVDEVDARGFQPTDQVFMTSDEYGVVPAFDFGGPVAAGFVDHYETLLASERKKVARQRGVDGR